MLPTIIISVLVLALIGLILGAVIAFTAKKFQVESDPRIEEVLSLLPGANCGGCGYAGCADFAQAIVTRGVEPGKCSAIADESCQAIAKLLGSEAAQVEKKVAVVFCSGSNDKAKHYAQYNGITDCRSAMLVASGAGKACRFGCLGYGSCARACPFGAIEIRNGLAVVHSELCVGCGKCEAVCPRKLIKLVPVSAANVHIYCNSLDKPVQRRKACSAGCLACRKCMKAGGEEHFSSQGFMVRVNYSNPPDESAIEASGCPTGCFQKEIDHRNPGTPDKEDKK